MKPGFPEIGEFAVVPAIDLKGGKCVRLRQGVAADATVYGEDPVSMAIRWRDLGGRALHLVDLDGAFEGRPVHLREIAAIVEALDIPVEVGGGLRTDDDVRRMLDIGVTRVILGTRAIDDGDSLSRLVSEFGGARVAVGIDARGGYVQTRGWVETSSVLATDLAVRVESAGVGTIIYTDTATDGMLAGPNVKALSEVADAAPHCAMVASGGVSCAADIAAIRAAGRKNIVAAIVGKALYDGRTDLASLNAAAED